MKSTHVLSYWDEIGDPRTPKQIRVSENFLNQIPETLQEHGICPTLGVLMKIHGSQSSHNDERVEIAFVQPVYFEDLSKEIQNELLENLRILGEHIVKSSYYVNNAGVYIPVSINHIKAYET